MFNENILNKLKTSVSKTIKNERLEEENQILIDDAQRKINGLQTMYRDAKKKGISDKDQENLKANLREIIHLLTGDLNAIKKY